MSVATAKVDELRTRLRDDHAFYAAQCLKIVDKRGRLVPFDYKRPQRELARRLEEQRAAGKPMRALICKARQIGFCLDPATRVLTADLRWVTIDALEPGQEIVAVDEDVPGGKGRHRKMRRAVVERKSEVRQPAFRLKMDNGETLVATAQHRFLSRVRGGVETQWREVGTMKVGDRIRHITRPWEQGDYEDGWMAGFLDGEGCLRAKRPGGVEVTISQREGDSYDRALAYLSSRGYTYREDVDERLASPGGKFSDRPVGRIVLHRTNELFRLIGQTQPTRFTGRSDWWEGRDMPGKRTGVAWARIVSIESLGPKRMVDIQTSHATFIAEGFVSHNSTEGQGMLLQRCTTRANHIALTVAHDSKTSGELYKKVEVMHANLPVDATLGLKPTIRNQRAGQTLIFGESSLVARRRGELGLNSSFTVQTAREVEAGRGFTVHSLWLSEVAFYPEARKRVALLNAVPDDPDTLVVQESTANGYNHFRESWVRAVEGRSDYIAYFSPWMDEPTYRRPFAGLEERAEFIETVGEGPWGEEEPDLIAEYECDPEQLHWRRWCIENKCESDLRTFWQEYPANWHQAFLASGQGVFSAVLLDKVVTRTTEVTDPPDRDGPERGRLGGAEKRIRKLRFATVEVDGKALWLPRQGREAARWRIWEHPLRPAELDDENPLKWKVWPSGERTLAEEGRYVAVLDPMSGELTDDGDLAYHAIQVIDHRTRMQVAEYRSRDDPDLIAVELHRAALYFNQAWVGIEITGGYGLSMKNKLARDFRYPFMYRRRPRETRFEKERDLVGWDTNRATVVELRDTMRELLRTMPETIRSRALALEMTTYRQDERGRMGPEAGKFADLLMAFAIAQQIARETPIRAERKATGAVSTTGDKVIVSRKAGY